MLQPQQRLGEFEIIRLLGQGGMGQVYEAEQQNPRRRVALKVLAPWLTANPDALQRFWREAAVPAQLDHPGIVRIISTGQTEAGVAYYTMHLVHGVSLSELIRRGIAVPLPTTTPQLLPPGETRPPAAWSPVGEITPGDPEDGPPAVLDYLKDRYRTTARIGIQAARALASAHRRGFVHRDIKPSNLMVDQHGQVYLVDFGLTRALEPDAFTTNPGAVRGTAWYMSPEQAHGEAVDCRADIYSLGVTLYELATQGHGPFACDRQNASAVLAQVKSGQALPPHVFAPDVPPALEQIIVRAMHFRPDRRYADADGLADDLERFLQGSTAGKTPALPRSARRRWFGKRTLGGAAVLLLVALLAVAAASLPAWHRSAAPPLADAEPAPPDLEHLFRRDRPVGVRMPLLREDAQPIVWRRLTGNGSFQVFPGGVLTVSSPPDARPTLIALDRPPRPWFEFDLVLQPQPAKRSTDHQLGIFLGWHGPDPADPRAVWRFISLRLDSPRDRGGGPDRLLFGTCRIEDHADDHGGVFEHAGALPDKRAIIVLANRRSGEHHLRVRVLGNRIAVIADEGPGETFDLSWVRRIDPKMRNAFLDPCGALGVWVCNGQGHFKNAKLMALPEFARE
jgi:serine/threonine protein kinase